MLLPYLIAAAKSEVAYKTDFIGSILSLSIYFGLQYVFFSVISTYLPAAVIPKNWLIVFFMTYTIGTSTVNFFSTSVIVFFDRLANGQIDPDLTKPSSAIIIILIKASRPIYIISAAAVVCTILLISEIDRSDVKLSMLPLYFIFMSLGVGANIGFIVAICSLTVITQRSLPADFIHSELSALTIIPHSIYPLQISYLLTTFLPMVAFASVSTELLYGVASPLTFIFALSAIISILAAIIAIRYIFNKLDSIGG